MPGAAAQRIARNTAWFTVGSVLQKLISFAYFSVVAMTFGVSGTAKYFFALTFTALFAVIADWGIAPVLTREIARDRTRGRSYIPAAFTLKVLFAGGTALLVTGLAWRIGYPMDTRLMIALATAIMILDTFHLGLYAVLRGLQRVHYEAIGLAVNQFVLAVSGILLLVIRGGLHYVQVEGMPPLVLQEPMQPIWLLVPYFLASSVNITIATAGCIRERMLTLHATATLRATWRWFIRTASPFAFAGALARIYTYSDTFLLSILASELAVGYYSIPFKITFAFQFIPLAFMGALYPAMSAVAMQSREQLALLFEQSLRFLFVVALPVAFGIAVLAKPIVLLLYGSEFLPSVVPMVILIAALPFIFANFPAGNLLNASDRQLWNTKLIGCATLVNVVLNVVLIPPLGATGAAIGALSASVVLFIVNLIAVRRVVAYRGRIMSIAFVRTIAACLVMVLVVFALRGAPLLLRMAGGAAAYCFAIFLTRAVRKSDIRLLAGFFARTPSV